MDAFTELVPGVAVATAAMFTTTSTLVMGSGGCLLIDPAVTVADLRTLADGLAHAGLTVTAGFATHPHWDHVLWSGELGTDVPRYAAPAAVQAALAGRSELTASVEEAAPGHDLALVGSLTPLAGAVIEWNGPVAEVITHDGHAAGHGAVFLPATGVLITGDMLSDIEIPLLDLQGRDPIGDYRTGLDRLAAAPDVRWVVPGHGHVGDAASFRERLAADYRYLDALESGTRDFDDPRLVSGPEWLRESHQAHLAYRHRVLGPRGVTG